MSGNAEMILCYGEDIIIILDDYRLSFRDQYSSTIFKIENTFLLQMNKPSDSQNVGIESFI